MKNLNELVHTSSLSGDRTIRFDKEATAEQLKALGDSLNTPHTLSAADRTITFSLVLATNARQLLMTKYPKKATEETPSLSVTDTPESNVEAISKPVDTKVDVKPAGTATLANGPGPMHSGSDELSTEQQAKNQATEMVSEIDVQDIEHYVQVLKFVKIGLKEKVLAEHKRHEAMSSKFQNASEELERL